MEISKPDQIGFDAKKYTQSLHLANNEAAILASIENLPDCAGVSIQIGCFTTGRSRASIYRDINAGRLEAFKINTSTRLRLGSLRKMLAGEAPTKSK